MTELKDQGARDRALDPATSFVVQAPAGSGKTGLLVRRYLALLASVDNPEEILAITFTRKATAEMQERILRAISDASGNIAFSDVEQDLELQAHKVVKRDANRQWGLLENPSRMRILTIDALSMQLVRSMPWSSRFAGVPRILDDAESQMAYREVAREVMGMAERSGTDGTKVRHFIELVNGDLERGSRLLSVMLGRRDLWLRGIHSVSSRECERLWQDLITELMTKAGHLLSAYDVEQLVVLLDYASNNLTAEHPLHCCKGITGLPDTAPSDLAKWNGVVDALLTRPNSKPAAFRKKVTVSNGFPAKDKGGNPELKKKMEDLLQSMEENEALLQVLDELRIIPSAEFSNRQRTSLEAIVRVIELAVAELKLEFSGNSCADFVEINQRAELALNQGGSPTELALLMDYRLRHILMDEVQDTSRAQVELIRLLTRGWEPGDGRTLFFVGDPMQSIYRFREAEIRNFLDIRESGIGTIMLESLVLESNFRSSTNLVEWFNAIFPEVFPSATDMENGAVPYSPAQPALGKNPEPGCTLLSRESEDVEVARSAEAREVAQLVSELTGNDQEITIGILGRGRSHLTAIAGELRNLEIAFEGVDMEPLGTRPAVLDMLAITRALMNPSDRIAWLSLLRAPWCGLTLRDLTALVELDPECPIPDLILEADLHRLSTDGQTRMGGIREKLRPVFDTLGRKSIYNNVLAAWLRLGGPATIELSDCRDCESYLSLLRDLDSGNTALNPAVLEERVARLWSDSASESRVKLLTIHKSKGLEFDVVIVPSLERQGKSDLSGLLQWQRMERGVLVAPLAHGDEEQQGFNRYISLIEKRRQTNELQRLLYVCCTRAKKRLYLSANLQINEKDEFKSPVSKTLLELLWPALGDSFITACRSAEAENPGDCGNPSALRRVSSNFAVPRPPKGLDRQVQLDTAIPDTSVEFSWTGETLRISGIAIHAMLQQIQPGNWEAWKTTDATTIVDSLLPTLWENGLRGRDLDLSKKNITDAIDSIRCDPRANWIFSDSHREIHNEWALTGLIDGTTVNVVLDRCFIDSEGVRWIIDYKSSRHEQDNLKGFLDQELERYSEQLKRYVGILNLYEPMETRAALYFPLLKGWRELDLTNN